MRENIQKIAIEHGYEPPYKSDREWLIFNYLPKLEGSILYVGVNTYNNFYSKIVKDPSKYFTIDICPERSKKGSNQDYPENNFIGNLKSHKNKYDNVCLFGIHGFNGYEIYNEDTYLDLMYVHENLLKEKGTLMWGPNNQIPIHGLEGKVVTFENLMNSILERIPFKKYEVLHRKNYKDNMIWWGKKK
jgi:hypothetical protein